MKRNIEIEINGKSVSAELNDSHTAKLLADKLPVTLSLSRWGGEYYGACGVNAPLSDDAKEIMEVGELAYWPPGKALCVFFGPTPASTDSRPRAASAANPVGRITGDASVFENLGGSVTMRIRETG
ncbi:MAG: hypothetical protein JW852_12295 [Spirochaetales bacterium]|nr:hypothetical protein [Spirochaetales bacterium]